MRVSEWGPHVWHAVLSAFRPYMIVACVINTCRALVPARSFGFGIHRVESCVLAPAPSIGRVVTRVWCWLTSNNVMLVGSWVHSLIATLWLNARVKERIVAGVLLSHVWSRCLSGVHSLPVLVFSQVFCLLSVKCAFAPCSQVWIHSLPVLYRLWSWVEHLMFVQELLGTDGGRCASEEWF